MGCASHHPPSHMLSCRLSSPCAASRCPTYCLTTSYDLVGRSSCDLFPLVISRCPACPLAALPAVLVPLRKVYLYLISHQLIISPIIWSCNLTICSVLHYTGDHNTAVIFI
ncbi:hypothetical protein DENSPDRAFT_226469 [Dentipellis sp. KUC8613]|nr:hypothetical protein DENSPDRAFT_226469 [Dentipellis sp. KUC8613]